MCGLVFIRKTDGSKAQKAVWKRYLSQKDRGMRGYGYAAIKNGRIVNMGRELYEADIEKLIKKEDADEILFHHRTPTSTENMIEATHPIDVQNESLEFDYCLAHNGIIHNADELKLEHEKLGFEYTTNIVYKTVTRLGQYKTSEFNDSESLAIEVALVLDGKKEKIETRGSAAFICLKIEKGTGVVKNVFFGRNLGNPLMYYSDKNFISITSQGSGALVKEDMLYKLDPDTSLLVQKPLKIGNHYSYQERLEDDEYGMYHNSKDWAGYRTPVSNYTHMLDTSSGYRPINETIPTVEEIENRNIIPFRNLGEDDITHPDDDKAFKDYADLENITQGLERDIEVLEQRKLYLRETGDEEGEILIDQQIMDKNREYGQYKGEMYTIAFEAGAFETDI